MGFFAYAMTVLSFDYDLSSATRKTEILFELHGHLWKTHSRLQGTVALSNETKRQLSMYFEYLSILPEEQRKKITGEAVLPRYVCGDDNFLQKIRKFLQQTISDDLKKFLLSGPSKEFSTLMVDDHFHGLVSRTFSIDIAIRDNDSREPLVFLELDSERSRFMKSASGENQLSRIDLLIEKLYSYHFPRVPLKRILLDRNRSVESYTEEILQTIQEVAEKKETSTVDNDIMLTKTNMENKESDNLLSFQKTFPWVRVNLKGFTG
jgi:hypothetical protein